MSRRPAALPPGLPDLLRDMAADLGLALMLRFAAEFGGREIYVPKRAVMVHAVAGRAGFDVLKWLVARQPGEKLLVPLGPHSSYGARIAAARRMVDEGRTTAEIVRALRMHERSVRRHRRAVREANEQADLFG